MAEGETPEDSWGNWWGSLVSAAKDKTEKAFEMVSQDLDEFTNTMQADTKKVVAQTAETLKSDGGTTTTRDRMKQSFSSLMEGITKALTVDPEDTSPPQATKHGPAHTGIFDRAQTRLRAVQVDTGTYLNELSGPAGKFDDWLTSFDLEESKGEISELLVSMVEVRSLYTTLVPSQVSHQDFWRRYFYKVHQLEVDEARKQALMKRAERSNVKEDSIGWDDEEWSGDEGSPPGVKTKMKQSPPARVVSEELRQRLSGGDDTKPGDTTVKGGKDDDVLVKSDPVMQAHRIPEIVCDTTVTEDDITSEENVPKVINSKTEPEIISETSTQDQTSDGAAKSAESSISSEKTALPSREKSTESSDKKTASLSSEESSWISGDEGAESAGDRGEVTPVNSEEELKMKVKGDLVVVARDRTSPSSESSGTKESSSDDWERDFDVELTEDDIKAATELAKQMNVTAADYATITGQPEEDWENWK